MNVVFTNDAYVSVKAPRDHWYSDVFVKRDFHEKIFRRIHTYLLFRGVIRKNLLDSGSWIGDNTIPWSLNITKDRKVFAIDPSVDNIAFTNKVAELNKITNVITITSALSDKEETIGTDEDIHHANFSKGGSLFTISANTLDYFYSRGDFYDIDFMHLDVENMEYKVILGGEKLISETTPIITFEQHLEKENYMEIVRHLQAKKYTVFVIEEVLPGCYHDCRNIISFPERIMKEYPKIKEDIIKHIGYGCLRLL